MRGVCASSRSEDHRISGDSNKKTEVGDKIETYKDVPTSTVSSNWY